MEQPRRLKYRRARHELDRTRHGLEARRPTPEREVRCIDSILGEVMEGLRVPEREETKLLRGAWPELVGAQIAAHSRPGRVENGALRVFVNHPGWMPELRRIDRVLISRIRERYPALRIRRIWFELET